MRRRFTRIKSSWIAQKEKPGAFQAGKSVRISITERREDWSIIEARLRPPAEWMGRTVWCVKAACAVITAAPNSNSKSHSRRWQESAESRQEVQRKYPVRLALSAEVHGNMFWTRSLVMWRVKANICKHRTAFKRETGNSLFAVKRSWETSVSFISICCTAWTHLKQNVIHWQFRVR